MMKRIFYLLIAVLLFSNCTHRIVRTGYQTKKSDYVTCDVLIKKNTSVADTVATKIGEIKLGESGFSVVCNEGHAINILKGEACAINADLIIITEENRPDLWSSCYRCRAEFYRFYKSDTDKKFKNDEIYDSRNVQKRVSEDRSKNTAIVIGSAVAGFVIGLLLFL